MLARLVVVGLLEAVVSLEFLYGLELVLLRFVLLG